MGCGASIPAVLAPQQPPTGAYLFGTATGGGEATLTLPEYDKSNPGSVLPLSLDGQTIAQIDGRSLKKKYDGTATTAEMMAHLTPVKGADGKLVALVQPIPVIRPSQTRCYQCSSNILSTVPRVDGLTPVFGARRRRTLPVGYRLADDVDDEPVQCRHPTRDSRRFRALCHARLRL